MKGKRFVKSISKADLHMGEGISVEETFCCENRAERKIKISFIVPVYNLASGGYLQDCLESLERVRISEMEVWVVDDGSTDSSRDICDSFAARDSRFHVLHQKNAGVSAARNKGIENATGEWLFFLDGDDLVADGIEKALFFDSFDNADVILFTYTQINGNEEIIRRSKNIPSKRLINISSDTCACLPELIIENSSGDDPALVGVNLRCVFHLYRRSFIKKNNIRFHEGIVRTEDMLFNLQVAFSRPWYIRSSETISLYRVLRTGSATDWYLSEVDRNSNEVIALTEKMIKQYGHEKDLQCALYSLYVNAFLSCVIFDYCHPDNPKSYGTRKNEFSNLRSEKRYDEALKNVKISAFKKIGSRSQISIILCRINAFFLLSFYLKAVRFARDLTEKKTRR